MLLYMEYNVLKVRSLLYRVMTALQYGTSHAKHMLGCVYIPPASSAYHPVGVNGYTVVLEAI